MKAEETSDSEHKQNKKLPWKVPRGFQKSKVTAWRRAGIRLLLGPGALGSEHLLCPVCPMTTLLPGPFLIYQGRESDWPSLGMGVVSSLPRAGSWSGLMTLGAHRCIHQGLFPENGSPEAVTPLVPSKLLFHGGWCGHGMRRNRTCREMGQH